MADMTDARIAEFYGRLRRRLGDDETAMDYLDVIHDALVKTRAALRDLSWHIHKLEKHEEEFKNCSVFSCQEARRLLGEK